MNDIDMKQMEPFELRVIELEIESLESYRLLCISKAADDDTVSRITAEIRDKKILLLSY